jgi:dienelactone hydrolase
MVLGTAVAAQRPGGGHDRPGRSRTLEPNMIGAYGPWAASLAGEGPARLSFRNDRFGDLDAWRRQALGRVREVLLSPETGGVPKATVHHQLDYDGLHVEHLSWQLPYGPPTEAYFLKPKDARGRLPAVLALHDHGGNKYFGKRKIAQISDDLHPGMKRHRSYYGGASWANELAKRGYAVLVHDAFAFESRRVRLGDVPPRIRGNLKEVNPESEPEIEAYNKFAADHEPLMAKSLFSAGLSWPGVFVAEDRRALDYLCARPDVDPGRVGCGGLSGGGLRTVYLAGTDERIACACCVGMMTTWRDYLLHKCYTHTWMVYIPGLPLDLDYPEVLGLRVPRPTLVLNDSDDDLFTLPEMRRADRILTEVFAKAGAADRYHGSFYPGPHKFDRPMQAEAFAWFDRWLKG